MTKDWDVKRNKKRYGGLIVDLLNRSSSHGLTADSVGLWCCALNGKVLCTQRPSLHPGVEINTSEL